MVGGRFLLFMHVKKHCKIPKFLKISEEGMVNFYSFFKLKMCQNP